IPARGTAIGHSTSLSIGYPKARPPFQGFLKSFQFHLITSSSRRLAVRVSSCVRRAKVCEMVRTAYSRFIRIFGILLMVVPRAQSQSAVSPLPRRLSLAQAENLLIERNLTVLAAK